MLFLCGAEPHASLARRIPARHQESPVLKKILIVGAFLCAGLAVLGAGAVVGVAIASRTIAVSATTVKLATPIEVRATSQASSPRVLLAQRNTAPAGD
jgi:hypothetical protein